MNKKIYTDGHMDGLNGVGGVFANSGYSLLNINGKTLSISYEKPNLTNNEAELLSIFHALVLAKKGDTIYSDSQVAINASHKGKSEEPRFSLIVIANKYLLDKKELQIKWIPREQNPVT